MKVQFLLNQIVRSKNWLFCLGLLCFLMINPMVVQAAENNPLPLDNFTGQTTSQEESNTNTHLISVLSDCVYDKEAQKFIFTVDSAADLKIISSVADGMITNNIVSMETNITNDLILLKNGTAVENPDLSSIKQFGNYILQYKGKKVLEFSILGNYSTLEIFRIPKGFRMEEVTLDGVPAQFSYESVSLEAEGTYEIFYVCEATKMKYSFKTIVDRTAPTLVFEELDAKGRAKGPVDISDREPGSIVKVMVDGEEVTASDVLTQSGKYSLTISDQAGNYNTYNFVIMLYFNTSGIVFLLLILGIVGGIAAYIFISAKHLRVF